MKKLFILLFLLTPILAYNITFYGLNTCPHCLKTKEFFKENHINFTFKEVHNETNLKELLKLYKEFNVPENEQGVPTLLIHANNKTCLVIGEVNYNNIEVLNCSSNYPYLFFKEEKKENEAKSNKEQKLNLISIILAALADSINPCVLAIMAMLLANLIRRKKNVLVAGLLFTSIITFVYFLMGLGILKAFNFVNEKLLKYFSLFLLLILAFLEIKAYFNYKPGFLSVEMPLFLRKYAKKIIKNTSSLWFVALSALILALFLVPCSSGPYLAILSLIASQHLDEKIIGIIYLIIYNLIFSLPMILITLFVHFGLKPEKILKEREKNIRKIHLVSGLILLLLALLIFIFY